MANDSLSGKHLGSQSSQIHSAVYLGPICLHKHIFLFPAQKDFIPGSLWNNDNACTLVWMILTSRHCLGVQNRVRFKDTAKLIIWLKGPCQSIYLLCFLFTHFRARSLFFWTRKMRVEFQECELKISPLEKICECIFTTVNSLKECLLNTRDQLTQIGSSVGLIKFISSQISYVL